MRHLEVLEFVLATERHRVDVVNVNVVRRDRLTAYPAYEAIAFDDRSTNKTAQTSASRTSDPL
jgi:hypothetical protein